MRLAVLFASLVAGLASFPTAAAATPSPVSASYVYGTTPAALGSYAYAPGRGEVVGRRPSGSAARPRPPNDRAGRTSPQAARRSASSGSAGRVRSRSLQPVG
jgi:hypothetical protein